MEQATEGDQMAQKQIFEVNALDTAHVTPKAFKQSANMSFYLVSLPVFSSVPPSQSKIFMVKPQLPIAVKVVHPIFARILVS